MNSEAKMTTPNDSGGVATLCEKAERLAQRFHEAYEELAPSFGYETRKESAVGWENVPEQNKRLMIAVCERLINEKST